MLDEHQQHAPERPQPLAARLPNLSPSTRRRNVIIAKAAFEPGIGHYEIFGVFSRFRDRIFPCEDISSTPLCGTATTPGTANASGWRLQPLQEWRWHWSQCTLVGLQQTRRHWPIHASLGGSGVGRYGTSGLADSSVHANGTLDLIRSFQGLGTLEWHGPKLDIYFNAGAEYHRSCARRHLRSRSWARQVELRISLAFQQYGLLHRDRTRCWVDFLPSAVLRSCTADTRVIIEGTSGFWYRIYDGSKEKVNKGRVQFGMQYSYVTRNAWSGSSSPNEPHGLDNMVFTSFRYYLP